MSLPYRPRGGFASRRGGSNWSRPFSKPYVEVKPDIQKHPLGKLQKTLHVSDLKVEHDIIASTPAISDCEYVASYNWLNDKTPTVMVPGKPPHWTPPQGRQTLTEDKGDFFRDPNAARYPHYPLAPAVQAILAFNPTFETTSIDLFACGSTLGNLLRFINGPDKAFRFSVEVIGSSVFFLRKENDPKELIPDVKGFGHTFPEANTTWEKEVKGSETHQRIIQYKLGNVKCLVRFECDGYIKDAAAPKTQTKSQKARPSEDDLIQSLSNTSINQPLGKSTSSSEKLTIKLGGSPVPQASTFDLKTRSIRAKRGIEMDHIYPLLWLKQIPNFIAAYHNGKGLFEDVRVQNIEKGLQAWEANNINAIRRLSVLIDKIIQMAKEDATGLLEVYFSGAGGLEIRSQFGNGKHVLPADLMEKWSKKDDEYDSASEGSEDGGVDLFKQSYQEACNFTPDSDSDDEKLDYTACGQDCGFCGHCTY